MDNILHRRDKLIISTVDLIDELGIQGISTREIAKREGVSEATLFRHFKNKNELIIAVLDYFSQFDEDIYQTTKLKNLKPKDAILFLIGASVEYYENYPAISSIMQVLDVLRYEPDLSEKVITILRSKDANIRQLIEESQQAGELKPVDAQNLSLIITGVCREICLKWRIGGRKFSLKERTFSSVKMLLDAFSL